MLNIFSAIYYFCCQWKWDTSLHFFLLKHPRAFCSGVFFCFNNVNFIFSCPTSILLTFFLSLYIRISIRKRESCRYFVGRLILLGGSAVMTTVSHWLSLHLALKSQRKGESVFCHYHSEIVSPVFSLHSSTAFCATNQVPKAESDNSP